MSNSRFVIVPRELLEQALFYDVMPTGPRVALRSLLDQPDGWKVVEATESKTDWSTLAQEIVDKDYDALQARVTQGDLESCPRCTHPSHDGAECSASPKCYCDYPRGEFANTPEDPKAAPQKVEGDPGTWSHCGKSKKHGPHVRKPFAMNEGVYENVQCNGTPGVTA